MPTLYQYVEDAEAIEPIQVVDYIPTEPTSIFECFFSPFSYFFFFCEQISSRARHSVYRDGDYMQQTHTHTHTQLFFLDIRFLFASDDFWIAFLAPSFFGTTMR